MIFVIVLAVAWWGQLPSGSRQMYKKAEQGNRDSRTLKECLCGVTEGTWADSSRDLD